MSKKNRAWSDPEVDTDAPGSSETLESVPTVALEAPKSLDPPSAPLKEYLALRVFATIAGPKWDQMAGFVAYARRLKLGPLTMEDWQAEFKKFQEKPVG